MGEKLMDIREKNNEHWRLLSTAMNKIDDPVKKVLDAGSGKTSLSTILEVFPNAFVDAVIFPGDTRKSNSIKESLVSDRYNLLEMDICKDKNTKKYDFVLAHLLLGETVIWGNVFEDLLEKLLSINSKYFIILDFKEDDTIDFSFFEKYVADKFDTTYKEEMKKENPQNFKTFRGETYIVYLLKRK